MSPGRGRIPGPGRARTPRSPSPSPSPIRPGTGTGHCAQRPSPICPGAGVHRDAPLGPSPDVPDLSGLGIGDSPPSPSPICRGRGRSPVPDSHRGVRALGPGAGVVLGSGSHPPAGSVRFNKLAGNGQDPSVDGAGAGQLARAGYPLSGRSRAVWHWHFDLVLVVTTCTSKIAFL